MRHHAAIIAAAALFAVAAGAGRVEAAPTSNITVSVTIRSLSVLLSGNAVGFGVVNTGGTVQSSEANDITVTNNGNGEEDFALRLANPAGWNNGSIPGPEVYALSALFVGSADTPTVANFAVNDVLTTTDQTATAAIFGDAGVAGADGADVVVNGSADLWFQFKAPTSTVVTTQQDITVTVSAVAS